MRYRFAGFELDSDAYKLTRGSQELHLQPLVFDVLHYLIRHRDRIVSKEELLDALWVDGSGNDAAVTWSISHVRRALSQTRWQKAPIETVHGRGYRLATHVAELDAPPPPPAPEVAFSPRNLPFVGRAELMNQLHGQLLATEQGSGKLTVLVGEAGIGKTRCATVLAHGAQARGFMVLSANSVEGVGAPVFWPWQQILRGVMQAQQSFRQPASALLAQLSAAGPEPAAPAEGGSWHAAASFSAVAVNRVRLFDGVVQLLLQAARLVPLFLLFDDLHWADAGTIELLSFAAPELVLGRCMIVGTQRERGTPQNQRALAKLAMRGQHVPLSYLTQSDIARYIAEYTSRREPLPELSAAVLDATAGNPLFVQETVRSLTEGGEAPPLHRLSPAAVQPSKLARDVLRLPLRALDPETQALLSNASVLGESFELTLLKHVAELDTEPLLDRLDAACQGGFVLPEAPNRYRFRHALIRTILYDDMPPAERVAAHRRAAELLVRSADGDQRQSEIATHYYKSREAGDPAAIASAAIRAGAAAEQVHASEDAATFFQWALELQPLDPTAGPRERAELLVRCGRALRLAGREEDARGNLEAAIHLSSKHGYGDLLVKAAGILRPTHGTSMFPDELVRGALQQALQSAPPGPHPQTISALSQLAYTPPISLDMEESKRTSALALALARERVTQLESALPPDGLIKPVGMDGRTSLLEALRSRMFSLSGPDDIDEQLRVCDEVLTLDQPRSDVSWRAHLARVGAYLMRGDVSSADAALEAAGHLGKDLQLPEACWHYERQRAQNLFCAGRFDEARTACKSLRAQAARLGLGYGHELMILLRGAIDWEQHGAFSMRGYVDVWDVESKKAQNAPSVGSYAARMAAEAGMLDSARRSWQRLAAQDFADVPKEVSYLLTLGNCAITAHLLGDARRAETLYGLIAPYPRFNTPDLILLQHGSVSRYLALLAATTERSEQAEQFFELALRENARLGHQPQLARTYHDYARWLAAEGGPVARERAAELAQQAVLLGQQLGMHWLADSARALVT